MSRRDNLVNASLGMFLLVVFFARLAAIAVVCGLGFIGFEWMLRRAVPRADPYDFALIGICALGMVWNGVPHARSRRWRNAFLSFAMAPIMGWVFVIAQHSSNGSFIGNWVLRCWLPFLMVMRIAAEATMGRLKFFLAAAIISAVVLVNSGLLGNTALAHAVADGLFAVTIVWFGIDMFGIDIIRNRYTKTPVSPLASPQPGA